MPKLMFDRNVDFKLETTENPYAACRALSRRARQLNSANQTELMESELPEQTPNPTATALSDYAEGRVTLTEETEEET